jgi:hypothetical protein
MNAAAPPDSLRIEINNSRPVELFDLTTSFLGLADEYKRFIERERHADADGNVRLYIKEIKTGSIIAEIAAYMPAIAPLFPFLGQAKDLLEFVEYLKKAYDFLLGRNKERPNITKQSYQNLAAIVEPVAKDQSSQLNISTMNGTVIMNINATEANAAQNYISRIMKELKEPVTGVHTKVVLYWYQATTVRTLS